MPSSQPHPLLFFDLDNTLIDRDAVFRSWLQDEASAGRLGDSPDVVLEQILELDDSGYGRREALYTFMRERRAMSADSFDAWSSFDDWFAQSVEGMVRHLRPDPALQSRLGSLGRRASLVLVSNGGSATQRAKLDKADLARFFSAVVISGEVGASKPERTIFDRAVQTMGNPPGRRIFIGDRPLEDVVGASKAGMETVWVQGHQRWPEDLPPPDHTVPDREALALDSKWWDGLLATTPTREIAV